MAGVLVLVVQPPQAAVGGGGGWRGGGGAAHRCPQPATVRVAHKKHTATKQRPATHAHNHQQQRKNNKTTLLAWLQNPTTTMLPRYHGTRINK